MSRRGRIALGVLAAVTVALVIAAVVLWVRAGEIVARRAEALARERYGLALVVGQANVSTSGIWLENVVVSIPSVEGAVVRFRSIHATGSPLAIARDRLAAVDELVVDGADAFVDVTEPTLRALAAFRRAHTDPQAATAAAATAQRALPPIRFTDSGCEFRDEHGTLVRFAGGRLETDGTTFRTETHDVALGTDDGDHVRFVNLRADVVRTDRLRATMLDADSVDVNWVLSFDSLDSATDTHLVRRLRRAASHVREALRSSTTDDDVATGSRLDRFTSRDFVASAAEASIATGRGAEEKRVRLHGISLRRLDATRLVVAGEGEGAEGISARWNLELEPTALRAVGSVRVTRMPLALVGPLLPEIPWETSIPGIVSVDVELEARGLDEVALRGSLDLEGVALAHPRLAATPLRDLALRIEGEGTLRPIERRFVLRTARFTTGGVPVEWNGVVEVGPGTRIVRGRLALPSTQCERAVHAIPVDVLGPLSGFHLGGTIAGRIDVDLDTRALDRTALDVTVDDQCTFDAFPPEADLSRFEAPFHHEVVEPDETVFAMDTGPGTPLWASFGSISPYMVDAVLAHEDGAFFRHRGFAPWAIRDAVVRNLREGRYVVGASTITMQLAKNLFLRREKTLIRKVQEVLLTWWLERSLDKERLLELYLNIIEYGPGIYGIRSASHFWFSCAPSQLTATQAAFLATILPAPKLYGVPASGALSDGMRIRLERFLRHEAGQGRLSQAELAAAMEELGSFRFRSGGGNSFAPSGYEPVDDGTNPLDFMPDSYVAP